MTLCLLLCLQDFSGPQKGEKVPGFTVVDVADAKEHDYVKDWGGAPTLIVFIHELTRPAAQCFRPLDDFADRNKGRMKALFVVLADNQDGAERHLPVVAKAVRLKSILSVSVDGKEGPGAYGLNKKMTMTVLVAKDGVVTANFAILSPNETDAPKIIGELEKVLPAELQTAEEMRAEILRLREEIRKLREELEALKREMGGGRKLPGKAPDDPKLQGLMRRVINREAADMDVDAVIKEIEEYIKTDEKLKKQALDGCVLLLHLQYGTEYARKKLGELKTRLEK